LDIVDNVAFCIDYMGYFFGHLTRLENFVEMVRRKKKKLALDSKKTPAVKTL